MLHIKVVLGNSTAYVKKKLYKAFRVKSVNYLKWCLLSQRQYWLNITSFKIKNLWMWSLKKWVQQISVALLISAWGKWLKATIATSITDPDLYS